MSFSNQAPSLFSQPELLLYDELPNLSTYQAILRAISKGCHTLQAISNDCLIGSSSLTFPIWVSCRICAWSNAAAGNANNGPGRQRISKRGRCPSAILSSASISRFSFRISKNTHVPRRDNSPYQGRELRSFSLAWHLRN